MPELEEGNLWLRGIGPLNMSLDHQVKIAKQARAIIAKYPEVESIVTQSGRPDDGTDTEGYYSGEYFVPLRRQRDWPKLMPQTGWRRWVYGPTRPRMKREIVDAMNADLERAIPGIVWNFSQSIRDNVLEALSGVKGDNSLKIFGPDLDQLELLAEKAKNILQDVRGISQRGHLPRPRNVAPGVSRRSGEVPEVGRLDGRRQQRRQQRRGCQGHVQHGRGREAVRHLRSLAQVAADQRDLDPGHPGGHHQQPGGPGTGLGFHAQRQRACLASSRGIRQPGRHVQPDQQHSANPAGRPGQPGGGGLLAGPERPVQSPRLLDHLSRARQAADRHQVQRPRPRPGQRRGRGQEADEGALQDPLPGGLEWRVRADGGSQRPAHVDHPLVAHPDLHPPVLGVPLDPGHARDLQQRLRPWRWAASGPCT